MPSRIVCFVCGSLGGEYQLHSRRRESGAYFPFLEHHEPPKGSRVPGQEGIVDSCHVCYAFLTQQWETYEQTNTPAIKRLYWLKRLDDGPFTGAEMKLQGEYMAQVMGLQYQPSCGDNCNVPLSPDESKVSRGDACISGSGKREKKVTKDFAGEGGVLDLSVPVVKQEYPSKKLEKRSHQDESKEEKHHGGKYPRAKPSLDEYSFICYTCGAEMQGVAAKVISSSRRADNEPFFPFLGKITPPKGAQPINSQGMCKVCENCFSPLCHQWFSYENNGTPNSARIFKIKDSFFSNDSSIVIGSGKDAQPGVLEVCYLCSRSWPSLKMCPLYTVPDVAYEHFMYFPFVRELRRPQGARPLNPDGSVRVCIGCYGNLQIQWQRFEVEKVPFLQRRYSLLPTTPSLPSSLNSNPSESSATPSSHPFDNAAYPKPSVTLPLKIEVGTSKSPVPSSHLNTNPLQQGGQPLPPNHPTAASVPSSANIQPNVELMRQQSNEGKTASTSSAGANTVPHPLLQAGERPKKVCYVCSEKVLVSKAQVLCSYPIKHEAKMPSGQLMSVPFFPFLANREPPLGSDPITEEGTVVTCSYCFYSLINQWREYEESKSEADRNRWLRKYVTCEFVCFICGLTVVRKKIRTLEVQKFPFLRDHKAPHNALVMWGGEGVAACGSCHFSLTHQYSEYERLGVPLEMRKYNWTVRDNSNDDQDSNHALHYSGNEDSNLSLDDAPLGLPPGATSSLKPLSLGSLSSGSAALAASSAAASANALAAAGGGKLPPKTAAVPPMSQQMSPSNGLTNSTSATTAAAIAAAAAANRSTSSFAAALRKLANQAQDPLEEAHSLKATSGSSPPSSAHSPRATTPKRSHIHPMAFPAHSAPSSLPTPPVVTIAPTPAHHHHHNHHHSSSSGSHHHHHQQPQHSHMLSSVAGDASRQPSDRVSSSVQSSSSSYDQLGKQSSSDRDQRPLSSHSRDDDRASMKDNPLSRTPSRAHLQVSVPTPTTSSSSGLGAGLPLTPQGLDLYARTFHPYHPEEEAALRQSLALSAYGIDPATYAAAVAAAASSAAYHPALVQHPAFPPGGFRLDDPLLLERYRLLQSPYFPFPPTAAGGILPPHPASATQAAMHPMLAAAAAASASQRYPAELLQQHYAAYLGSPSHPLMDPRLMAQAALLERSRLEEEKLREEREKERTKELEREREKREKERAAERELAYRAEREREREQQRLSSSDHHHHHHHRSMNSHEASERRDILTVPTRLPASDRDRDSRGDHLQHQHHRSSSQQHFHHSSHDLVDVHLKRSSGLSHPEGLPCHDAREPSSSHHYPHYPTSHHQKDTTAFNIHDPLHQFKNHSLGKPPELRPSNHEHLSSKSTTSTAISSSSSPHSSRHQDNHHHHHKSHLDPASTASTSGKSDVPNPFSHLYPSASHPLHQQLLEQWAQSSTAASKLVSSYPPPPLISNQQTKEKTKKSSENSGIFRPFDEPKNKSNDDNNSSHQSKTLTSSSSVSLQQQHKNMSLHHQGSLIPSSSTLEKSNSSHFTNPFMRKDEKLSSSSSEVLSIPVLRVPPQSHMTSDSNSRSNHNSEISNFTTSSVDKVVKNRSSSSSSLSSNVQNRIERFDFKSLARECTTSSSSGSPPPLVQKPPTHPPPPSSSATTSSIKTQQPLFTNPYKSFYSTNPHHHILESAPFSLPALMESAFHEDLLQRQKRCLSKLDIEERRLKELGRRTGDSDGELEEVEEKATARLTMIGRTTPMSLETSEDKLNLLEALGLTTLDKKKELQVKKERRRRRLQRLASVSPMLFHSDEPVLDGTSQKDSSKTISPELFNRLMQAGGSGRNVDELLLNEMNSEEKAQFFKQLGMLPQSHAEKSDIEMKRLCAEFINAKSNGIKHENCLKRKHEDTCLQNEKTKQPPSQSSSNSLQPFTSSLSSSSPSSSSPSKEKEMLSSGAKLHRPSLSSNKNTTTADNNIISLTKSNHSASSMTTQAPSSSMKTSSATSTTTMSKPDLSSSSSSGIPPVIFPSHPLANSSALHSSFAEDFHKSVLQESFNYHQKQQQHQLMAQQNYERSADSRNRSIENHHRLSSSSQPSSLLTPSYSSNASKQLHPHAAPHNHHHQSQNSATTATNADANKRHNNINTLNSESLLKQSAGGNAHPQQPSHPSPQLLSQAALAGLYPWPGGLNAMMESYQRKHGGGSSSALHNGDQHGDSDQRRN